MKMFADEIKIQPLRFHVGDKVRIKTEELPSGVLENVAERYKDYGCSVDSVFEICECMNTYCKLSYNGVHLPYSYNVTIICHAEDFTLRDSGELMNFLEWR